MPNTPHISPAFGQANLTNCERELIHLPASVQPFGLLIAVAETDFVIVQISNNCDDMLGQSAEQLLGLSLHNLGGNVADELGRLLSLGDVVDPTPFQCAFARLGRSLRFEGTAFRQSQGVVILELEPIDSTTVNLPTAAVSQELVMKGVSEAIQLFSTASSIGTLADAIAKSVHDLTGFDRVMVYKFDADGNGKVIAEARDPRLEPLLGHNYPASDIPQRARDLYLRNRVRLLVDVNYLPAPLVPRQLPETGEDLDMSLCHLRSMSPLHLQYLKNMGVTATLVVSLVREGKLWGLISAHHYAPRHLRFAVRGACDLLAEVAATRIAAIENYASAQVALLVQRLEQRLVEATSVEGDWRMALFRNPAVVMQPLDATGLALFQDGELLTAGEVPSTPGIKALLAWIEENSDEGPFVCGSVVKANPALESLTPTASGVVAVKLSTKRPDYLIWLRKEQLQSITWAGDPNKPFVGDSPLELSPRRSFAAWSEIVRGTSLPWTAAEIALARAFGEALIDIIVQVEAVRLLIGEHQLAKMRAAVKNSRAAVAIADVQGKVLYASEAFWDLFDSTRKKISTLEDISDAFQPGNVLKQALQALDKSQQSWRGEGVLNQSGHAVPLAVRAEAVLGRDRMMAGLVISFADQSHEQRTSSARQRLERSLQPTGRDADDIIMAILANASIAAMDIADGQHDASSAPQLLEVERSAHRAARLYQRLRSFDSKA